MDFQHIDFREKNKYLQAIHANIHQKSSLLNVVKNTFRGFYNIGNTIFNMKNHYHGFSHIYFREKINTFRPYMSIFIKNQVYSMVFKTHSRCFLVSETLFSSWKIAIKEFQLIDFRDHFQWPLKYNLRCVLISDWRISSQKMLS